VKHPWKWVLAALAVGAVSVAAALLPASQWAVALVERVQRAGAAGVALFGAIYLIAPLLLVPASVLTLGAGFLYGPIWGTLLVSPLSVAAAAIAFLLGRTLARRVVERRVAEDARFSAIDRAVGESGFRIVLLLRLSPVIPFNLLNYVLGLTRVGFGAYLVASLVGMLPGSFLYVYLGAAAGRVARLSEPTVGPLGRAAFWVGIVATVIAVAVLTRIARRALGQVLREKSA
jgi:uncharacterized membrane protein YdjX (TVP38/TMEM64 family)